MAKFLPLAGFRASSGTAGSAVGFKLTNRVEKLYGNAFATLRISPGTYLYLLERQVIVQ